MHFRCICKRYVARKTLSEHERVGEDVNLGALGRFVGLHRMVLEYWMVPAAEPVNRAFDVLLFLTCHGM